ncbi:protein NYNRIN-like [Oratosquilla oratoria]|uniref:protein NYNRIN-like n=1 Tax=Oratosquilla oratoria TaxID=337810 RepID=UPI003F774F0D
MSAATVAALDLSGCVTIDEEMVLQTALEDHTYQSLVLRVSSGDWESHRSREPACLRPFYGVRDRLAVSRGLVTYTYDQGCVRLVIPEALRQRVAASLHASHQGLDSMLRRARQTVYWPEMEGDLQHYRATCNSCNANAPSQPPEPLILTPPPDYPFQQTVADLFQLTGQTYLVYADRLTGWLEVAHLPSGATSSEIMKHLGHYFTRWGTPEQLSMTEVRT